MIEDVSDPWSGILFCICWGKPLHLCSPIDFFQRSISSFMLCRYFPAEDQNVDPFSQSIFMALSHFLLVWNTILYVYYTFIRSATICASQMICMYFEPWRIRVIIHIKFISHPSSLFPYLCVMQKSK